MIGFRVHMDSLWAFYGGQSKTVDWYETLPQDTHHQDLRFEVALAHMKTPFVQDDFSNVAFVPSEFYYPNEKLQAPMTAFHMAGFHGHPTNWLAHKLIGMGAKITRTEYCRMSFYDLETQIDLQPPQQLVRCFTDSDCESEACPTYGVSQPEPYDDGSGTFVKNTNTLTHLILSRIPTKFKNHLALTVRLERFEKQMVQRIRWANKDSYAGFSEDHINYLKVNGSAF